MEKLKKFFASDKAMPLINFLFILALCFGGMASIAALLLWAVYLFFSSRRTKNTFMKVFYLVLAVAAAGFGAAGIVSYFI